MAIGIGQLTLEDSWEFPGLFIWRAQGQLEPAFFVVEKECGPSVDKCFFQKKIEISIFDMKNIFNF